MVQVTILIPSNSNDGSPFLPSHDEVFCRYLVKLFNGFSMLPDLVKGGWEHEGIFYPDQSRRFVVSLNSITEGNKVLKAVEFAKAHYGQINIYVSYLGLDEVL